MSCATVSTLACGNGRRRHPAIEGMLASYAGELIDRPINALRIALPFSPTSLGGPQAIPEYGHRALAGNLRRAPEHRALRHDGPLCLLNVPHDMMIAFCGATPCPVSPVRAAAGAAAPQVWAQQVEQVSRACPNHWPSGGPAFPVPSGYQLRPSTVLGDGVGVGCFRNCTEYTRLDRTEITSRFEHLPPGLDRGRLRSVKCDLVINQEGRQTNCVLDIDNRQGES